MTNIYTKAEVNNLVSSGSGNTGSTFSNGIDITGGHLLVSGASSWIYADRISHHVANSITVDSDLEVNSAILCDTIKARVANELTIDDNVAISGVLNVDTIQSNLASPSNITINDNVQINQNLVCNGSLRLGTASSAAKVVIAGGPQNIPNEETAIRVSSGLNNVKIELENTATNGKLYEVRSTNNGSFDITDRTGGATRYSIDTSGNHTFSGASLKFGTTDILKKFQYSGRVKPDGSQRYSNGVSSFTVSHTAGTGVYSLTLGGPGTQYPVVSACVHTGTGVLGFVVCQSGSGLVGFTTYNSSGTATDLEFSFTISI